MPKRSLAKLSILGSALLPALLFAQGAFTQLETVVATIGRIVNLLIPIFFALALLAFFYGIFQYIRSAGDPAEASAGKSIMIYGVIAIAVMASVFGITRLLQTTFGINDTSVPTGDIRAPRVN